MAYFLQQAARHGAFLPNGQKIGLDFVLDDSGDGYLAVENGYIINQIRGAIGKKTGGWKEIAQGDYDEAVKKKALPTPGRRRGFPNLNAVSFPFPRSSLKENGADAAFAVENAVKPEPIAVPTAEQMRVPARPRVGKLGEPLRK